MTASLSTNPHPYNVQNLPEVDHSYLAYRTKNEITPAHLLTPSRAKKNTIPFCDYEFYTTLPLFILQQWNLTLKICPLWFSILFSLFIDNQTSSNLKTVHKEIIVKKDGSHIYMHIHFYHPKWINRYYKTLSMSSGLNTPKYCLEARIFSLKLLVYYISSYKILTIKPIQIKKDSWEERCVIFISV